MISFRSEWKFSRRFERFFLKGTPLRYEMRFVAREITKLVVERIRWRVLSKQLGSDDHPLKPWSPKYAAWREKHPGRWPGKILTFTGEMLMSVKAQTRTQEDGFRTRVYVAGAEAQRKAELMEYGTDQVPARPWLHLSPRDEDYVRRKVRELLHEAGRAD